jgi:hypothetical protein
LIVSTPDYIVVIDKGGDLDWETTTSYDKKVRTDDEYDLGTHNSILNEAALLEATPCGFGSNVLIQVKRLIGEALACSFDHDYAGARKTLLAAEQYLRARSEETSRYWYLLASAGMTVQFIALGGALGIWRTEFSSLLTQDGFWLTMASVTGAIGALLSVIGRSGNLKFDCSAGRGLHYLEGASRIWAGALSGVLVALAVKAEILLTALTRSDKMSVVMVLAAFAAGASERLAPSLMSKFEAAETERGRNPTPKKGAVRGRSQ